VQEAVMLIQSLGIPRIPTGHELLASAIEHSFRWQIAAYDAIYVALAEVSDGVWLTADARAARRVKDRQLVRML
jgi:predicted nucleic acid-binding protein